MKCRICDAETDNETRLGDPCKECQTVIKDVFKDPEDEDDSAGELENLDEMYENYDQWDGEEDDYHDELSDSDEDTGEDE